MKRKTRRDANRIHALRRLKQRHGIKAKKRTYSRMNKLIRNGNARLLYDDPFRPIYRIILDGEELTVVYDERYQGIVTVLPPENYLG